MSVLLDSLGSRKFGRYSTNEDKDCRLALTIQEMPFVDMGYKDQKPSTLYRGSQRSCTSGLMKAAT